MAVNRTMLAVMAFVALLLVVDAQEAKSQPTQEAKSEPAQEVQSEPAHDHGHHHKVITLWNIVGSGTKTADESAKQLGDTAFIQG